MTTRTESAPVGPVVVTADDFGLAPEVNRAVEQAHRHGILTAASLMVGERAAADAVARARTMPQLAVGLHLTLVERKPTLPVDRIPDLVDRNGLLRTDLPRYGAAIFFRRRVQDQVAAEIEAQFQAFARTGLPLSHVDSHQHFHLHPTVARLIMAIGPRFGMKRLRVPCEPAGILRRVEPATPVGIAARIAGPYARRLGSRARRAGLSVPDQVFGLAWSGAMTAARVEGILRNLPAGSSEIYLHPATAGGFEGAAPGYRYREELAALSDPAVVAAMGTVGFRTRS